MIFKKATLLSILMLGAFGLGLFVYTVPIRSSDRVFYKQLTQETRALRSSTALERHPSSQIKLDAQKDIYLAKEGKRSHFQIISDASELFLKQKQEKVEAKEELEKVTCLSSVGELYAEKGTYHYPDYNFIAEEVECTHALGSIKAHNAFLTTLEKESLRLSGDVFLYSINEDPPLSIASDEAFVQAEEQTRLSAMEDQAIEFLHNVKIHLGENTTANGDFAVYKMGTLTLFPKEPNDLCFLKRDKSHISAKKIEFDLLGETVICSMAKGSLHPENETPIFFAGETLYWQKKKNTLLLEKSVEVEQAQGNLIHAEKATLILAQQKPKTITFETNVQLFSPNIQEKETFALAETLGMDLENKSLSLKGDAQKRALFWQDGVRLSAPEVVVYQDPETKKECVQGKGDVRFTFNADEQKIIERFISKYL